MEKGEKLTRQKRKYDTYFTCKSNGYKELQKFVCFDSLRKKLWMVKMLKSVKQSIGTYFGTLIRWHQVSVWRCRVIPSYVWGKVNKDEVRFFILGSHRNTHRDWTHMHSMRSDLFDWPRTFVCKRQGIGHSKKMKKVEELDSTREKMNEGRKVSVSCGRWCHSRRREDMWGCALAGMLMLRPTTLHPPSWRSFPPQCRDTFLP